MPAPSILITAYEPYDVWPVNASQLVVEACRGCLLEGSKTTSSSSSLPRRGGGVSGKQDAEVISEPPPSECPDVRVVVLPVDFDAVYERLAEEFALGVDASVHLGQAPGYNAIALEAIGVNIRGERHQTPEEYGELTTDGATAYRSTLPLSTWARKLCEQGLPATVSYHAGTYLCNAALYLAHYFQAKSGRDAHATFLHVPLSPTQVSEDANTPSLPTEMAAAALKFIVRELTSQHR